VSRTKWRRDLIDAIADNFGSYLDPDLLAIIRIGLTNFFHDSHPDFSERFPTGYSSSPYDELIDEQNAIGWEHFIRGKVSAQWNELQYRHTKRYNLQTDAEGWLGKLVKLMANSSFRLWELRNGCRHGTDDATKQQAKKDQAHRELRCLYLQRENVLPQDTKLFRETVDIHLLDTTSQIRDWILHNRRLIGLSVRNFKAHHNKENPRMQSFYRSVRVSRSSLPTNSPTIPPISRVATQVTQHFHRHVTTQTTTRIQKIRPIRKFREVPLLNHFRVTGTSTSVLPSIQEATELATTSIQRRQIRRRHLNIDNLDKYPDHPG
jgi:hypothetical protein